MMTRYRKEFRKIAKKLTLADIQCGISDNLSFESLFKGGHIISASDYLMGVFSKKGIIKILEVFGFIKLLEDIGLFNIDIEIDTNDPHIHRLYAYTGTHSPENKICELVFKQAQLHLKEGILPNFPNRKLNLLQIEWLLLQNPKMDFNPERPPLPGQSHPGLGLGDRLMELLIIMTRRLRLEGMVNKPNFLHTAFMFTKEFVFTNPNNQAVLYAIRKDLLSDYSFYTVAWATYFNCILNTDDKTPFLWEPDYLILPLTKDLIKYFRSKEYQHKVQDLTKRYHFCIDVEKFTKSMKKNNLEIYEDLPK
ncbi:MAG: hypothetical protein KAW56_05370 [Candidatus Marinimicrobia bacterium]|nr:hypothetical protein [Candidatus Neomarinimicrobiota bacterium]MCK4446492.1 hypothetical protein [Candidatus Neomarinimicrobiota bacterium]